MSAIAVSQYGHLNITDWNEGSNSSMNFHSSALPEIESELEIKCFIRACSNHSTYLSYQEPLCNVTWDGVYCWPPTPSGTSLTKLCSEIFQEHYPDQIIRLEGSVTRRCLENGTWEQDEKTDYGECVDSYELYFKEADEEDIVVLIVRYMLFVGSIFSLACLGIALTIFYYFRCLWCTRVAVHVHLMLSLVLRFIFMLIIAEPFVLGRANSYRDVEFLCESVLVLFLYATLASMCWMFIQGLHLNVTLMSSMIGMNTRYHFLIFKIIGWVFPVVIVTAYVIVMAFKKQEKCWEGYADMKEIWILLGPIMIVVVINGLFLANVLRILLEKMRNSNLRSDESKLKAAAKATVVLFPVLGINNLLFLYNPGGEYQKYFIVLNTFFGCTQGIFVAVVYCFFDKDVTDTLRRSLDRVIARRNFDRSYDINERSIRERSPAIIPLTVMSTCTKTNDIDIDCDDIDVTQNG